MRCPNGHRGSHLRFVVLSAALLATLGQPGAGRAAEPETPSKPVVVRPAAQSVLGASAGEVVKVDPGLASHPVAAPPDLPLSADAAREISAQALELQAAGEWEQARERLAAALARCAAGGDGRECRLLLQYSLGYSYQRQSELSAAGHRSEALPGLDRAAAAYALVLEEAPEHAPTRANLLSTLLAGAEIVEESGELEEALARYARATEVAPRSATPRRRVVEIHRRLPVDALLALMPRLAAWEAEFPDVSRDGYRLVIERRATAPEAAERALERLLRLLVARRHLTVDDLAGLPREWRPVAELVAFLETGAWSSSGWWVGSPYLEDLLPALTLAAGNGWLVAGDAAKTESCWRQAGRYAPPFGMGPEWLDLFAEQAALYAERPELDPGGEQFHVLEDRLFGAKGEAYRTHDLGAVQRMHTVLGLIYAHRGAWESGQPFHNATFQLRSAVETAERRREREGAPYDPLPHLKGLLAEGYRAQGRPEEAGRWSVAAGEAYLDSDDFEHASRYLASASTSRASGEAGRMKTVLALRQAVSGSEDACSATCSEISGAAPILLPSASVAQWNDLELRGDFLARQRFKLLADCSKCASDATERGRLAAAALGEAVQEGVSLVGTKDLLRLESVQKSLAIAPEWMLAGQLYQVKAVVPSGGKPVTVEVGSRLEADTKLLVVTDTSRLRQVEQKPPS